MYEMYQERRYKSISNGDYVIYENDARMMKFKGKFSKETTAI